MDIYLVRHGEAAASWSESADPGLSARGREQARAARDELLPRLDSAGASLVSSPLARARETALPLADATGLEPVINDAFREIPSPVPLSERQAWLRAFMQQRWEEQPESLHAWRQCALDALHSAGQTLVVFSHFLVINAVVGRALGRNETLCFWPDNGSITHLRLAGDQLQLVSLGREMTTRVN